jgi:metallo-beta-lactamase family protein
VPGPTLTFLGATGTVTGSRFLVTTPTSRVLVDVGLYQGLAELRRRNWQPFPSPAAQLDAAVLTHAHLDHTGYLPRLVRDGFRGTVTCTDETRDLTEIVLRDSAHLQEEDASYANERGYSRHDPAQPLYTTEDVTATLPLIAPVPFDQPTRLAEDVTATLRFAGHILGSATVVLDVAGHRVQFSGDLGRAHHPLLRPPRPPEAVGAIVVESTYGDRSHPPPEPDVLASAIRRTAGRGGVVLIPAFAVDRTELVLMELRRLRMDGMIPDLPVHVDSPMALGALSVYRRALRRGSDQFRADLLSGPDPFDPGDLHSARTPEESRRLNRPGAPCIVVSASGMAAGGRVVHHLEHLLPDARNTVVLTGFQAEGTRGRSLRDGAPHVKMYGRYVPVRAEVVDIPDFSVHADADEVLEWLASAPRPPRTVYVVHGEARASAALAHRIRAELGCSAVAPAYAEHVLLD